MLIFILGNIISSSFTYAQTGLPKIIPASPDAEALFKYMEYPVSHATGLPQISVPIYEVVCGDITVPISISYHASGRKVYDQDGSVALGWTLNAGGMISRTTYGDVDFGTDAEGEVSFPSPFKLENDINYLNDFLYLAGIENYAKMAEHEPGGVQNFKDSEYDIFSYSIGNISGNLVFQDDNGAKTPVLTPIKPYIVEWGGTHLDSINIIDDKGVLYHFATTETQGSITSSWAITRIISADKSDTINFTYDAFYQERVTYTEEYRLTDDWRITNGSMAPSPPGNESGLIGLQSNGYSVRRVSTIEFKHGKVVFNYHTDAEYEGMIRNIQVYDKHNQIVETTRFEQSRLDQLTYGLPPTHKLDRLIFSGKEGGNKETYLFEYYPTVIPTTTQNVEVQAQDLWGYYNAKDDPSLIPYFENIEYIDPSGGTNYITIGTSPSNRAPNLGGTQSGILKKIVFPTGGSTEFEYELNRYFDTNSQQAKDHGGLRVRQIRTSDGQGATYYKTYKYGVDEVGYGFASVEPSIEHFSYQNIYAYFGLGNFSPLQGGTYRETVFTANFLPDLHYLASKPIIYPEVTEYHGTDTSNIGKTVYKYNYHLEKPRPLQVQRNPAGQIPGISMSRLHVAEFNTWEGPLLAFRLDYKKVNALDSFQLVKQIYNDYENVVQTPVKGIHVVRTHFFPQNGTADNNSLYADKYAMEEYVSPPKIHGTGDYEISVGSKNLILKRETIFSDDGYEVTQETSFTYNNQQLVSQTHTINSLNDTLITQMTYPFEDSVSSIHQQMVSRNMINYTVEQKTFKNDIPLQSVKTKYKNWGNDVITPEIISTKQGNLPYESRLTYLAYDDAGNITSISKKDDIKISYIYGYNQSLPIAEVYNATPNDIFHTSFEDTEGNSNINDSKTGSRSRLDGYQKALSGLSNGIYILSYWKKSGGSWILLKDKITVTDNTYTINLSGQIDDIRFYPSDANMSSYTYDPLVGITSQTDPNDIITYYEFDEMGKLKSVKDYEENKTSEYYYNYRYTPF